MVAISILGAGPSGFALAADVKRGGSEVLLYSHPDHLHHANQVRANGCLEAHGLLEGFTSLQITADMSEAVAFSRFIILTVPSTGHATLLEQLQQYDLRQHTLIAVPGNLVSLIKDPEFKVANILESNMSPYSCRMNNGQLLMLGKKKRLQIAALHSGEHPELRRQIQSILPIQLDWCSNVIEVSLTNVNGIFHPLMMLMNAGRIESAGTFHLYAEGLTRSVANAMEALDNVRVQIARTFGLREWSAIEISNNCYDQDFADFVDLARNSPPHNKLRAPTDMAGRNMEEDVPDILVPWYGLAEKLGIDASPISAVIILAQMACGRDYSASGRNMRKLHLDHLSKRELLDRFRGQDLEIERVGKRSVPTSPLCESRL